MMEYIEWVGWFATALFAMSYVVKAEVKLLMLQATAACVWCVYGVLLSRMPLIVANVVVASSAGYRALRLWQAGRTKTA